MSVRILFVDNFDSFTFNLVDAFASRGCMVDVYRNTADAQTIFDELLEHDGPKLIVLSPGPGSPDEAGCCAPLLALASGRVPVLGICLGHQVIVEHFGGSIDRAPEIVHGKTSPIEHDSTTLFDGLDTPLVVGRYHSLCGRVSEVPEALHVSASLDDIIMGVRHVDLPIYGLQFHPESILTRDGGAIFDNVIELASRHQEQ